MDEIPLSDLEFAQFQRLIHELAGIALTPAKKALVAGRLGKRLRDLHLHSYAEYLARITRPDGRAELQQTVDLLTTNETFFFREPTHFDFLRQVTGRRAPGAPFRVWSAACSSGEEPYSIAMVLADCVGQGAWEVVASDISMRVLEKAERASYPLQRAESIPREYLLRYCLKGIGSHEGTFTIEPALRSRVRFMQLNLVSPLTALGLFDVIFLRNVMIYFDTETKRSVVGRVSSYLKPDGFLLVSHSESLHGLASGLETVMPSVYRKVG